jgi:hypothetical protein
MHAFTNANDFKGEPYITVGEGQRFYPSSPTFDIHVIAGALSKQCRFGGHVVRHYSVAEHSIMVRNIMKHFDLGDPFEGLMHDAHEAYLIDMPSPWKVLLPDYKKLEKSIEKPLRKWAGVPEEMTDGAKLADHVALYAEAIRLIEGGLGSLWSCESWDPKVKDMADRFLAEGQRNKLGLDNYTAYNRFMEYYYRAKDEVSI